MSACRWPSRSPESTYDTLASTSTTSSRRATKPSATTRPAKCRAETCSQCKATFTDEESSLLRSATHTSSRCRLPSMTTMSRFCDPLESASELVGKYLDDGRRRRLRIHRLPGRDRGSVCTPSWRKQSGLTLQRDFSVGYSPETDQPGRQGAAAAFDHQDYLGLQLRRRLTTWTALRDILSPQERTKFPHIRSAEAAKVIENVQRDVNIALVNELAQIFKRLDIDTEEVLEAAGTKWNFIPLRPGLVGGHCIGVDPYYLANKAQRSGYFPELIVASRRINDGMGKVVSAEVMRLMNERRIHVVDANVLVLGLAFKENCPDLRNTKVDQHRARPRSGHAHIDVHDPWVDPEEAQRSLVSL